MLRNPGYCWGMVMGWVLGPAGLDSGRQARSVFMHSDTICIEQQWFCVPGLFLPVCGSVFNFFLVCLLCFLEVTRHRSYSVLSTA